MLANRHHTCHSTFRSTLPVLSCPCFGLCHVVQQSLSISHPSEPKSYISDKQVLASRCYTCHHTLKSTLPLLSCLFCDLHHLCNTDCNFELSLSTTFPSESKKCNSTTSCGISSLLLVTYANSRNPSWSLSSSPPE